MPFILRSQGKSTVSCRSYGDILFLPLQASIHAAVYLVKFLKRIKWLQDVLLGSDYTATLRGTLTFNMSFSWCNVSRRISELPIANDGLYLEENAKMIYDQVYCGHQRP